jgi:hypothetical protein
MSVSRIAAGLALAGMTTFAPSASANFPYTCDTIQCFVSWCVSNSRDCTDSSPFWAYCPSSTFCIAGSGDITRYVAYCTIQYSVVTCIF